MSPHGLRGHDGSRRAALAEHAEARDRLLSWAAAQARRYRRLAGEGGRRREAMEFGDLKQHNLRAALDWAADGGSVADGLIVMCRMEDWWRASGSTVEAWERLRHLARPGRSGESVSERLWLEGVICLAAFATLTDDDARAVVDELTLRAERKLDELPDRRLRLRLATQLAWVRLDLTDVGAGQRLEDLLAESRRLGGLDGQLAALPSRLLAAGAVPGRGAGRQPRPARRRRNGTATTRLERTLRRSLGAF